MVKVDWEARLVWLPQAKKYNRPESPNVVRSWRDHWDNVPECALKVEAYHALKAFTEGLGEAFAKAFAEACAHPSPNQEQEQEQEYSPVGARPILGVAAAVAVPPAELTPAPAPAAPGAEALVFARVLQQLITEAGGRAFDFGESTRLAECRRRAGTDLKRAAQIATWAFRESAPWTNGHHWRLALTTPEKFWHHFADLEKQHANSKRPQRPRKGGVTCPMAGGDGKSTAISVEDFLREAEAAEKAKADEQQS